MLFFPLLQVTKDVALLSRWMAVDLYIREVDSIRFELSMNRCSDKLSKLAHKIIEEGFCMSKFCKTSDFILVDTVTCPLGLLHNNEGSSR